MVSKFSLLFSNKHWLCYFSSCTFPVSVTSFLIFIFSICVYFVLSLAVEVECVTILLAFSSFIQLGSQLCVFMFKFY